jgi:hypothetical protein
LTDSVSKMLQTTRIQTVGPLLFQFKKKSPNLAFHQTKRVNKKENRSGTHERDNTNERQSNTNHGLIFSCFSFVFGARTNWNLVFGVILQLSSYSEEPQNISLLGQKLDDPRQQWPKIWSRLIDVTMMWFPFGVYPNK